MKLQLLDYNLLWSHNLHDQLNYNFHYSAVTDKLIICSVDTVFIITCLRAIFLALCDVHH